MCPGLFASQIPGPVSLRCLGHQPIVDKPPVADNLPFIASFGRGGQGHVRGRQFLPENRMNQFDVRRRGNKVLVHQPVTHHGSFRIRPRPIETNPRHFRSVLPEFSNLTIQQFCGQFPSLVVLVQSTDVTEHHDLP